MSRIDPERNRMVGKPIRTGGAVSLAVGQDVVWVVDVTAVWRIDAAGNRLVGRPIDVGDSPQDVAVGAGAVWVTDLDGAVSRIDPKTNRVIGKPIYVGGAEAIAVGEGSVWVARSGDDAVSRINPRSMDTYPTLE